jgi:hypothetical protein
MDKSYSIFCDKKEQEFRRNICNSCEKRDKNRCSMCGCFLLGISKWKAYKCPLNKFIIEDNNDIK